MLKYLYIRNYTLIDELKITFDAGFSVITGETGAGKSIILGAINLLLGQRADVKAIRQGADKCVLEAIFNVGNYAMERFFEEHEIDYDVECILRREINSSGKSRAFINDTPVSLAIMKELGEKLIDIHSQHKNLLLNKEGFQLDVLDLLAENSALLTHYKSAYAVWRKNEKELAELESLAVDAKNDEEYIRFQLAQFAEAELKSGEKELLEQEVEMLENAEDIKSSFYKLEQLFEADEVGLLATLKEAANELTSLSTIYTAVANLSERLGSVEIELKDIASELASAGEQVVYDPLRLKEVTERLNIIYSLEQKHRVSGVEELLKIEETFIQRIDDITSYDDRIADKRIKCEESFSEVKQLAAKLTATRMESAKRVEDELSRRLLPLGMPNVRFKVAIDKRETLSSTGEDIINFLFSANKNGSLQDIASVASGGEIARVMLSIKAMIAGVVKLPTIIFDEIDTGVSGEIADRMADMMQDMGGQNRQVISITHLPQIAARGSSHFKVYKEDNEHETISNIKRLNEKERIEEIAHMLSGATITEAALSNAKSLLGFQNR